MDEQHTITSKQLITFAVALSFIVSVIGTVLVLGLLGPIFGFGQETNGSPFIFNRPKILEKIVPQNEERVVRHDEVVIKVVEDALPAVVSIVATKDVPVIERYYIDPFGDDPIFRQFFGGEGLEIPQYRQRGTEKREVSSGTGFIVSSDGMVLTNKHVVADTEAEYTVFLNDGARKPAKVIARDPLQDLAVLNIEGKNLPAMKMGDSSKIKIGQSVIAIGNALEFRNTVSVGVISGLRRSVAALGGAGDSEVLQELVQTDAAINPGNSGGPLLNLNGEVVAINTAMARGAENIGFAIPIDKAKKAMESVKQHGRVVYPFLGVRYTVITKELAETQKLSRNSGVLVVGPEGASAVIPGSPAEKAGIKERDIIVSINGSALDEEHSLASVIQERTIGDEVVLKIVRDGKEFEVKAKLEERRE